jgi:hypothetical protein
LTEDKIKNIIKKYIPAEAINQVVQWLIQYKVHLKIAAPRRSILGNYRSPDGKYGHRISINSNLNPYAFLLTFVHELAHLTTYEKHRHLVLPHGIEWKREFQKLMSVFFDKHIFPKEIEEALQNYMSNPAASSCRDENLMRLLKKYDKETHVIHLEEVAPNTYFQIDDGRIFLKGEKLRKNYKCIEQKTKKAYRIHGLMPVIPIKVKSPT